MAVVVSNNPSGLRLKFELGLDPISGRVKTKSKTYSNLKHDAVADDVYAVGALLASLQTLDLLEVTQIDNTTLSQ